MWGRVVGALLAGPIVFAIGWLMHKYLIARVTGARVVSAEAEGHYTQIILTLGIALILANGGLILFGSKPLSVQTPLSRESWELFGVIFLNQARTVGFVIAILCAIGLYLFLSRVRLGKAIRAAADNPIAAAYVGVDVDRSHRLAFGIGVGITAVAGGLIAMSQSFQPYIGFGLRHRDVRRRRARRHGLDPRRLLGRPHHRPRAADVALNPALPASEHRDLRGVPAHHLLPAAGHVRPRVERT